MSDQSSMFGPTISGAIRSATSLPESESGVTPCDSLDGQTPANVGRVPVPANPSARPAKVKRSTTKGIFGQSSFASSKHEDLSFALANKLRPLTDSLGSTLFNLTWMTRITPAGRSISALRASEPLTEDSVFIGWPTPQQSDTSGGGQAKRSDGRANLNDFAMLAGWPTARATDAEKNIRTIEGSMREMERKGGPQDLMQAATLSAWGTPAARDWKSGDASQETLDKNARPLNELAMLAGWSTPARNEFEQRDNEALMERRERCRETSDNGNGFGLTLGNQVHLAGWPTPMAGTPAQNGYNEAGNNDSSRKTVAMCQWPVDPSTDSGPGPIGYLLDPNGWEIVPASGQLNASHSRWLMGLPRTWDEAGIVAFLSLKRRRRAPRDLEGTVTE